VIHWSIDIKIFKDEIHYAIPLCKLHYAMMTQCVIHRDAPGEQNALPSDANGVLSLGFLVVLFSGPHSMSHKSKGA
jgi:hypothetical protein